VIGPRNEGGKKSSSKLKFGKNLPLVKAQVWRWFPTGAKGGTGGELGNTNEPWTSFSGKKLALNSTDIKWTTVISQTLHLGAQQQKRLLEI